MTEPTDNKKELQAEVRGEGREYREAGGLREDKGRDETGGCYLGEPLAIAAAASLAFYETPSRLESSDSHWPRFSWKPV